MHNVELMSAPRENLELHEHRHETVLNARVEAQRARPDRHELRTRLAVARGEQGHFVAQLDEGVAQVSDDALRSTIELGWHRLSEWRDLGYFHEKAPEAITRTSNLSAVRRIRCPRIPTRGCAAELRPSPLLSPRP